MTPMGYAMSLLVGWVQRCAAPLPDRALSNNMDEVADVRSANNVGRIVITVREREPVIFFDNDCSVAVHLRDVSHVTRTPGAANIGRVVRDGPTDGVLSTRKPIA